jgi:hypothetical protein
VIERVAEVGYGRQASVALASAIERAKAGRPLAPVTVLVPSNLAGLTARRVLGSGVVAATEATASVSPRGIANVSFVTPFHLAGLLAADQVLATRPLTNPVLGAAVRRALAEAPGPFAAVADHEATEAALASLYSELSNIGPDALDAVAASGASARAAVHLHRAITSHLGGYHGEADVARAAAERADLPAALAPYGPVIWHLPAPTTPPVAAFIGAVLAAAPSEVILACSGDPAADAPVRATCRWAGVALDDASVPAVVAPTADRIVSVTDADEEVRVTVRQVVQLVADGVDLDRIGIFFPVAEPYLTILHQQLAGAGIPATGPSPRRLAATAAGRTLLGALALPGERWRRDRVLKIASSAPVRAAEGPARPSAWETLSRAAGVIGGLDDWTVKLLRHSQAVRDALDAPEPSAGRGWIRGSERDLADLDALRLFVLELAQGVAAVTDAPSWSTKTDAARDLLHQLLGPGHRHGRWPDDEQDAFERVEDALARLRSLDELEPSPSHAVFVRALAAELDTPLGRVGTFGRGLTYGPLASAPGHDLDAVFVLGCVEGICPAPRREDAMLADAARLASGGELALRSARLEDQHRSLLAALASAPRGRRTLSAPRGDLRSGRHPLPSRWLLDSAGALAGEAVYATDFAALDPSVVDVVGSFAAGLRRDAPAACLDDRDLGVLLRDVSPHRLGTDGAIEAMATHPVGALVGRGLRAQVARRSRRFTEWDGNVSGQPIPSTAEAPISATRLETRAQCGFRYFLGNVLGLRERDDPERLVDLSPMDRGSVVHAVLERFIAEAIDAGVPEPDEPWGPAERLRVHAIADGVFAEVEAMGRSGRALHWRMAKRNLTLLLADVLRQDDEHRRRTRSRPVSVELPFGLEDRDPVTLTLHDGRTLRFRGYADRVDRTDDDRLVVIDYKSGKPDRYRGIDAGDPVRQGLTLQLGLYAEAGLAQLGGASAEAQYWLVDSGGAHTHVGYPWTPDRRERFVEVVTAIADGVEAGVFPMVPGEWDSHFGTHETCRYCDFDSVCPQGRGEQAAVKVAAPELRRRAPLEWVEPT